MNVSGAVTLAGTLEVRFINGFQAAIPNGAFMVGQRLRGSVIQRIEQVDEHFDTAQPAK